MIEFALLILSYLCKKIIGTIFLIYGSFMAACRWELRAYWKGVAIINDKQLNVVGKYALNQALAHEPVFGNPLMTVSAAMHEARLHKYGKKWEGRVNKLDDDHFYKAFQSHKNTIKTEYNRLFPNTGG